MVRNSLKKKDQWLCRECGKWFTRKSHLKRHISDVYEGLKPFKCPYEDCSQSFSRKDNLKQHISAVHECLRPFSCPYEGCGKAFSRKGHLKQHISGVHEGVKPFLCPHEGCGAEFSERGNLNQHISAVHEGVKPFLCRIPSCNESFSRKGDRNSHEKSHNGVPKPIWNKQGHKWEEIFRKIWEILKPGTERRWKPHLKVVFEDKEYDIIPEARYFAKDIGGYVIWDAKRQPKTFVWKDMHLYPLVCSRMEFFVLFGKDEECLTPDGTPYSIVSVDTLMKRLYEKEKPKNAQQIRNIHDNIYNCRNGFFDFEAESNQIPLFDD